MLFFISAVRVAIHKCHSSLQSILFKTSRAIYRKQNLVKSQMQKTEQTEQTEPKEHTEQTEPKPEAEPTPEAEECQYRRKKLRHILGLFADLGVDIREEIHDDNSGKRFEVEFAGFTKEEKVEHLLQATRAKLDMEKLDIDETKFSALREELINTSGHNLKIIRSRLRHLKKQSWADVADGADEDAYVRLRL